MTVENKRYLGIGILLTLVGVFKLYSEGIYQKNGEIYWFNILVPFGMGIAVLVYTFIKIYLQRK